MRYFGLHNHSTFSALDGYGTPGQIVARLKDIGQEGSAVTDHGNVFAHVSFEKAMRAAGLKPIFGCEFYCVEDMEARTKWNQKLGADGAPHVTIIAMSQKGYDNLLKLSTLSYSKGFYYRPRIDWNCIAQHQEGLVVLSGCVGGWPSGLILNPEQGPSGAHKFIAERRSQIEHFYVELIPEPGLGKSIETTPRLIDIARDLQVPLVMTSDAHFPRPEDHNAEDIMLCIGLGVTMDDPTRYIKLPDYQYYCTGEELLQRARDVLVDGTYTEEVLVQAIENSAIIADMCEVEVPRVKKLLFPGITVGSANDVLWRLVCEGVDFRIAQGTLDLTNKDAYIARAYEEFNLMREKDFCDYLLCLTDICRWVKSKGALVMCRGSAGGCLLLWLLQCSETDSIECDLDFYRFMDPTRNDPPDIDVDVPTYMKEVVIEYISGKYGAECVSQIAAFSLIRARVAVQDVAHVHKIPREEYGPLSSALDSKDDDVDKQLSSLTDKTALAVLAKYPVFGVLDGLVGQCRQSTIHAAGVLISSEPIQRCVGIMAQPNKPRVASCDKHGAADLGFLKLDLLAVSAYDVIDTAMKKIGSNTQYLYSLRRDDPAVYATARAGRVAGVFQLDGAAIRVGHEIGLDSFEELCASSALCRPGAAAHVPLYRQNKYDPLAYNKYVQSKHPIAVEIVKKTYGVLLYQEQVMKMCHLLGRIPMDRVQKLRKRIANASFHGKELGAEYGDDFHRGCIENGCSPEEAHYWWEAIKAHGIYSFNKAHCFTYGIVCYWHLWLITYFPDAYYEAFLRYEGMSSSKNDLLMKRLIREYKLIGGDILMVEPGVSQESFYSPQTGTIVGGWQNIIGVGAQKAKQLVKCKTWSDVQKLDAGLYYKFYEAGLTGHVQYDQQAAIELAPWMPVLATGRDEADHRYAKGFGRPCDLPFGEKLNGDVCVSGYVTAIHKKATTGVFKGEQRIYVLEDESGAVEFRVPGKNTKLAAALKAHVKKGDYVSVAGWWAGEVMFIKDAQIIKRRI